VLWASIWMHIETRNNIVTWRLLIFLIAVYFNVLVINKSSSYDILTFTVNEMGPHWVLTLLYLKNVLYWPEDDRLRSKHIATMWPECIYNITVLIYSCVLMEYNALYKSVTTQRDGLCQIHWHNVYMEGW